MCFSMKLIIIKNKNFFLFISSIVLLEDKTISISVVLQKSDVFTEGEEDLEDDNTVNEGEEEDEEVDDDDPDRSIEFRSEIGSTGKTWCLPQCVSVEVFKK